jgi:hypothetical protein
MSLFYTCVILTRRSWEDNIKMGLQEVGVGCGDWIRVGSGERQVAGICEYGKESSGSINM